MALHITLDHKLSFGLLPDGRFEKREIPLEAARGIANKAIALEQFALITSENWLEEGRVDELLFNWLIEQGFEFPPHEVTPGIPQACPEIEKNDSLLEITLVVWVPKELRPEVALERGESFASEEAVKQSKVTIYFGEGPGATCVEAHVRFTLITLA